MEDKYFNFLSQAPSPLTFFICFSYRILVLFYKIIVYIIMIMSVLFTSYDNYISFLKIFLFPLQLIVASFHRFFYFSLYLESLHMLTLILLYVFSHYSNTYLVFPLLSSWSLSSCASGLLLLLSSLGLLAVCHFSNVLG